MTTIETNSLSSKLSPFDGAHAYTGAVAFVIEDGVAWIVLNRPERRNPLSREVLEALEPAIDGIGREGSVRAVVIGSRGPVFSSGHDLNELAGADMEACETLFGLCGRVMLGLRRLAIPVIARVQGLATAAGCQLVAACDLAIASTEASFATPGVKIGLYCGTPMIPLVRAIAPRGAMEMLLLGKAIDARRAYELGLVNRVVAPDRLDSEVFDVIETIKSHDPAVLGGGKLAFYEQLELSEFEAYERMTGFMARGAVSAAAREGIDAFLRKRKPIWPGTGVGSGGSDLSDSDMRGAEISGSDLSGSGGGSTGGAIKDRSDDAS